MKDLAKLRALYDTHATANDVQRKLTALTAPFKKEGDGSLHDVLIQLYKTCSGRNDTSLYDVHQHVSYAMNSLDNAKAAIEREIEELKAAEAEEEAKGATA